MADRPVRLGDVVDDYCPRCKLLMNHGVMALSGEAILKVRCNTCLSEHPFRHGKGPKKKDPLQAAYDEVMGKIPKAPPGRRGGEPD